MFKIFIQKSTWIMFIFLVVIIVGSGIIAKIFADEDFSQINNYGSDWRTELTEENNKLMKENKKYKEDDFTKELNLEVIEKNNYYLEEDIKPLNYGALQGVNDNSDFLSVVSLLTIIIAAGIVANEFRWGTIKSLLIRPVSRAKVLASKYITVLIFAVIALLFVLIISWITGAILFGLDSFNAKMIDFTGGEPKSVSVVSEIVSGYGYSLVNLLMMATFAFMISAVFRNSSLAIGIAIFLMFSGNLIVQQFSQYDWAKYILFANTNLQQYATGNITIEGMTLTFSIIVLLVYYALFMALSWSVFTKRDVAGH